MKRKTLFFVTCAVIIVCMLYFNLKVESNDDLVKNYMKNKHGVSINILEKNEEPAMVSSEIIYVASPKDSKEVVFTVTLDTGKDTAKIKDTYNHAVETNKEYKKLKKGIPRIKELGFKGEFKPEPLFFQSKLVNGEWVNFTTLPLHLETKLDIPSFEEKELDRFYELVKLIQDSGASIQQVTVEDSGDTVESKTIVIKMDQLRAVSSKEELLTKLKTTNWELASFNANKKWEDEAKKIENERFSFGAEYQDYWFNCLATNKSGDCTTILASVTYQKGGLNQRNPYLKEDLDAIFSLFDHTMKPKPTWELAIQEAGDPNSVVRFKQAERNNYKTTEDLIKGLFKK